MAAVTPPVSQPKVHDYQKRIHAAKAEIEQLQKEQRDHTIGQISAAGADAVEFGQAEGAARRSRSRNDARDLEHLEGSQTIEVAEAAQKLSDSLPVGPEELQPEELAPEAEAGVADVVEDKKVQPPDGRLPPGPTASKDSLFDLCFRQGLCGRPLTTSPRAFLLAATLALVVLVSFKIGLSLGTTGMRLYQGVIESLEDIPKRTSDWRQTREEILAEAYANVDPRLRGRSDKPAIIWS